MTQLISFKLVFYFNNLCSTARIFFLDLRGASISYKTSLSKVLISWPHKLEIKDHCIIESLVSFKHDGPYTKGKSILIGNHVFIGTGVEFNIKEKITIGDDTLIGAGSRFIDHDHGLETSMLMRLQDCPTAAINIANNVWIGANVVILKGVNVATGAVIAAGAVVNKSIPPNEIWGGVPAKKIGKRE